MYTSTYTMATAKENCKACWHAAAAAVTAHPVLALTYLTRHINILVERAGLHLQTMQQQSSCCSYNFHEVAGQLGGTKCLWYTIHHCGAAQAHDPPCFWLPRYRASVVHAMQGHRAAHNCMELRG